MRAKMQGQALNIINYIKFSKSETKNPHTHTISLSQRNYRETCTETLGPGTIHLAPSFGWQNIFVPVWVSPEREALKATTTRSKMLIGS